MRYRSNLDNLTASHTHALIAADRHEHPYTYVTTTGIAHTYYAGNLPDEPLTFALISEDDYRELTLRF